MQAVDPSPIPLTSDDVPQSPNTDQESKDKTGEQNDALAKDLSKHFDTLMKIIRSSGRTAALPMVEFIKKHLKGTKLIFVVGATGSGKTTLLGEITRQDLKIGNTSKSGTLGHQVIPAIIHGKQYIFVDTVGFGAADMGNKTVYDDIMGCLYALGPWVNIIGVFFVHSVRQDRLSEGEMTTIKWLQCFCGPQFFKNITIVFTQWDRVIEDDLEQAYSITEELKKTAFHSILCPPDGVTGGRVYNHGLSAGTSNTDGKALSMKREREVRVEMASNFVRDHYEGIKDVAKLQARMELDLGWSLYELQAALCLFASSPSTIVVALRKKAMLLDLDEDIQQKAVEKSKKHADGPGEGSVWKWWGIAKEVAWVFWGLRRENKSTLADLASAYTADTWDRLRRWWSGETPPV